MFQILVCAWVPYQFARLELLNSVWLSDSPLYDVAYIFNRRQIWTAGRPMSLKNSNKSHRINGTFTYMQVTHAVGTDAPPYPHRGWFLHFLVTVWMAFFIFGT